MEGITCEPNNPSIVATKKNIFNPPPKLIEYLLLLNQQDARKEIPLIPNIVRNAPKFNNATLP